MADSSLVLDLTDCRVRQWLVLDLTDYRVRQWLVLDLTDSRVRQWLAWQTQVWGTWLVIYSRQAHCQGQNSLPYKTIIPPPHSPKWPHSSLYTPYIHPVSVNIIKPTLNPEYSVMQPPNHIISYCSAQFLLTRLKSSPLFLHPAAR